MNATLRRPTERNCERCGRRERWDDDTESWRVADNVPGSVYCIHEWDINGRYNPIDGQMEGDAAAGGGAPAGAGSGGDGVEADADEGHDA